MTTRRKNDLYPTESAVTKILLQQFPNMRGCILEPCAGPGLMVEALKYPGFRVIYTNDIDSAYDTAYTGDAGSPTAECWQREWDWVVTNPPFSEAERILPLALGRADKVAFLLRLTYMEPTNGRADWLKQHADQMIWLGVLNPRPKFRKGEINPKTGKPFGTDNATVAWFVWDKQWSWARRGIRPPFGFVTEWNR